VYLFTSKRLRYVVRYGGSVSNKDVFRSQSSVSPTTIVHFASSDP